MRVARLLAIAPLKRVEGPGGGVEREGRKREERVSVESRGRYTRGCSICEIQSIDRLIGRSDQKPKMDCMSGMLGLLVLT